MQNLTFASMIRKKKHILKKKNTKKTLFHNKKTPWWKIKHKKKHFCFLKTLAGRTADSLEILFVILTSKSSSIEPCIVIVFLWRSVKYPVADPGFSRRGGRGPRTGAVDPRGGYVSKILHVKTKESGPVGGGARRARPPLHPPMIPYSIRFLN